MQSQSVVVFSEEYIASHQDSYAPQPYQFRVKVLLNTAQFLFAPAGDENNPSPEAITRNVARVNLQNWKQKRRLEGLLPGRVGVYEGDWGVITGQLTEQYGEQFAVLNMANAYSPGGGVGLIAQEENIFRRTDCLLSITDKVADIGHEQLRYKPAMTKLINAENGKVYLDTDRSRFCFLGPEEITPEGKCRGYEGLPFSKIFSFYELRAAATDCRYERFDLAVARKKIAAQLDTLIEKHQRYVVLGAFGCGAFQNPPEDIAALYKEEIAKRASYFDHVAFAIFWPGYGPKKNFEVFSATLENRIELSLSETGGIFLKFYTEKAAEEFLQEHGQNGMAISPKMGEHYLVRMTKEHYEHLKTTRQHLRFPERASIPQEIVKYDAGMFKSFQSVSVLQAAAASSLPSKKI